MHDTNIVATAVEYITRGWRPIPIPHREKACRLKDWTDLRINEGQAQGYFSAAKRDNIGVLLGEPSGHLVDVDLDSPEAVALASRFLPFTGAVFGRASKRASHRLYCVPSMKSTKFAAPDGQTIVEIRSTGAQTVFPPSTHASGEEIGWEITDAVTPISVDELTQCVARLATAALLAREWPKKGSRHEAALALSGTLLQGGFAMADAEFFMEAVAEQRGCEDVEAKVRTVSDTFRTLEEGRAVTGIVRLAELFGGPVVQAIKKWLRLASAQRTVSNTGCTDAANGERLARYYGEDVRYVFSWSRWMRWDGQRWADDKSGWIQKYATQTARNILVEAANSASQHEQKELARWALTSQSKARLEAMMWAARVHIAEPIERWDQDRWLLNVSNGTIDLRTGELRPHNRADLITKLVPLAYQPDALCPRWLTFLGEALGGDQEMVEFLQHAVGYTLTGDTGEQCVFIMHGTGANGKSTFVECVRGILGEYGRPSSRR